MPTSAVDQHRIDHPELYRENSKYRAKITFTERCEALAAYKHGIEKPIIAACYGINVSTLNYIVQPHSRNYRNVRREYNEMGHDRFIARFLTEPVLERLSKAGHDWKATLPAKDYDEVKQALDITGKPDPRAKRYEGRHTLTWINAGTVYIAVTYVDAVIPASEHYAERQPGWYVYLDPTSPAFADWMGGEGPHGEQVDSRTSTTAYEAWVKTIGHDIATSEG